MQPIRRKEEGEEQKYNPADGCRREKEGDTQHRQNHGGNRQQEGTNIKQKHHQNRQKGQRQNEGRNQYFQQYLHHQNLLYSFYLYLDLAEDRAERHIPMTMEDWAKRLDLFLMADDRELLQDAGKITAEIAKAKAETEFEKYRVIQDRLFMSDFDKYMLELEENAKK